MLTESKVNFVTAPPPSFIDQSHLSVLQSLDVVFTREVFDSTSQRHVSSTPSSEEQRNENLWQMSPTFF